MEDFAGKIHRIASKFGTPKLKKKKIVRFIIYLNLVLHRHQRCDQHRGVIPGPAPDLLPFWIPEYSWQFIYSLFPKIPFLYIFFETLVI